MMARFVIFPWFPPSPLSRCGHAGSSSGQGKDCWSPGVRVLTADSLMTRKLDFFFFFLNQTRTNLPEKRLFRGVDELLPVIVGLL